MPTDPHDLAARLAATTKADTTRGLAFNALFETLEEHLGPDAPKALDPAGKGKRTEFFSFPMADWLALAYRGADFLERPVGSVEGAFRAYGYRTTSAFFGSMLGGTVIAMSGGTLRGLLGQVVAGYRSLVSYGDRRLEWTGERQAVFTLHHELVPPPFHLGVLEAAADSVGARIVTLEARPSGLLDLVCELHWEEPAARR